MKKIPTNWYRSTVLPIIIHENGTPYVICSQYNKQNYSHRMTQYSLRRLAINVRNAEERLAKKIALRGDVTAVTKNGGLHDKWRAAKKARETIDDLLAGLKLDGNNELKLQ